MANALDELKKNIENAVHAAEQDVKRLESTGHLLDRPQQLQEAANVNLDLATSQSKVFKTTLRQYALKKVEKAGAMVPMLSAQDKELYKKFSMNEKISQLRERLKKAMEKALSQRHELFDQPGGATADVDKTDQAVESGNMNTGEIWVEVDKTQDRTLDTVAAANEVANSTIQIADSAAREQQRQLELTNKIREEVRDLKERYGISFAIMGTIFRQIACDGCFQALFAVLILTIIAFLCMKYV